MSHVCFAWVEAVQSLQENVTDIKKVRLMRVNADLTCDSRIVNFFAPEMSVKETSRSDKQNAAGEIKHVFRALKLENSLNKLREYLNSSNMIICFDKLSLTFMDEIVNAKGAQTELILQA